MSTDSRDDRLHDQLHDRLQTTLGSAYTLTRELGGGGMSRVFLAREAALERDVVVKVLSPDLAAGVSAERFTREIKLAASLQQANIVPLHAAGESDGLPYYTMPFVDGLSLRARLQRNGALPAGEAVSVLRDVARALAYAHEHGVVHRDIKPENILLSGDAAVVTDFGIAKALSASRTVAPGGTLTQVGTSIGTPQYMAPEQAAGDPATDHRADLYALGCIAYEMLTGAAPFAGRPVFQLHAAHLTETPSPVDAARPDVPRALARLVARCLEKDPARRPQSAREVLAALDEAGSVSTTGNGAAPAASGRRRTALMAAAAAVVAAAALGAWALRSTGTTGSDPAQVAGTSAVNAHSIAVLPFENLGDSADAYFAEGVADAVRGKLAALPGLTVIARTSAAEYRKTTKPPEQIARELGVRYLLTGTVRFARLPDGTSHVQVSPELVEVPAAGTPQAGTPQVRWQEPFDAVLADVFGVQRDIATRVVDAMQLALGSDDRARIAEVPTTNAAAYDAYLRGEAERQGGSGDPASTRRAIAHYERAVALDSGLAAGWRALASARANLYATATPTPELARQARAAAARAAVADPNGIEGYRAWATYYATVEPDVPRLLQAVDAARRLAPREEWLLAAAANANFARGRFEEALRDRQTLVALDPRSAGRASGVAEILSILRRLPEARAAASRARALAPRNLTIIHQQVRIELAAGDSAAARRFLAAAAREVDPTELAVYVATYEEVGWFLDDSTQRRLLALGPEAFYGDPALWSIVRTMLHHWRGDTAQARLWADTARRHLVAQVRAVPDDAQRQAFIGVALAYLGRRVEAVEAGERARRLAPVEKDAVNGPYVELQLVRIHLLTGDREQALDGIERLLGLPYFLTPAILRFDPTYAPLRGNPRFERLVAGS